MTRSVGMMVTGLLACALGFGQQTPHFVWSCAPAPNDPNDTTNCHTVDTTVMGGVRFDDYRVTNPSAAQIDPSLRQKELAALGPSTAAALCAAPPTFSTPAPTITFDQSSVVGQIYWRNPTAGFTPSEFMDVQFANLKASNGFTSLKFGFRMIRVVTENGTEIPQFNIQIQAGNAGLENIPGLPANSGVGFGVDPVNRTASVIGTVPASDLLRGAILGVFLNAESILKAAKFTVTNPPPAGKPLWSQDQLVALAAQAQPWIAAGVDLSVPVGPPWKCTQTLNGYGVCDGSGQLDTFTRLVLTWGGEYLGLRTRQSFEVLNHNLLMWANAKAPPIDPDWAASGKSIWLPPLTKPLLMLWPTLKADPSLSDSDQQTIENWLTSLISPRPFAGWFSDDLGYFAESVNMADAIRRSDDAGFALGVARFYGALDQMRPDGSFPLAARLSACSAAYSNVDLLHLVSIAEMAATQGYDLYSLELDGKTLDTAIKFMLDAYENPDLLYQYSKAGGGICFTGKPGDPPDFSFYSHPTADLAWMEPYIARFPFSATSARLRKILGSNISTPPFPLSTSYSGLNATCAFRKSNEFQPVDGAKLAIVSGDNQTVAVNQSAPAPLTVRLTDNSGKVVAGILVSFAVVRGSANLATSAQVLTDGAGLASANVKIGPGAGPVTVTATALGARTSFAIAVPGLAIYPGGIGGIGGSVPAVTTIAPGSLFSIYGQNFVPAGTGRRANPDEMVHGVLPTNLLGVCVNVDGIRAPLLDVYPGQVNAVAPVLSPGTTVLVTVTTGCGAPNGLQSRPQPAIVQTAAPEFLYFAHNANGQNPAAAINAVTGAYVGPVELGAGFGPAHPGDLVTIFGSGFGPTLPPATPGAPASGVAPVTSAVTVRLGYVTLNPSDILYVGAAPGSVISQLNIRIPPGIPAGNQPLQIVTAGIASPAGAYLPIATH